MSLIVFHISLANIVYSLSLFILKKNPFFILTVQLGVKYLTISLSKCDSMCLCFAICFVCDNSK